MINRNNDEFAGACLKLNTIEELQVALAAPWDSLDRLSDCRLWDLDYEGGARQSSSHCGVFRLDSPVQARHSKSTTTDHTVKTTATHTIAGLSTYFLDEVAASHPSSYPANMALTQFAEQLAMYRDGMNDYNNCRFPAPSRNSVAGMFLAYQLAVAARA